MNTCDMKARSGQLRQEGLKSRPEDEEELGEENQQNKVYLTIPKGNLMLCVLVFKTIQTLLW